MITAEAPPLPGRGMRFSPQEYDARADQAACRLRETMGDRGAAFGFG